MGTLERIPNLAEGINLHAALSCNNLAKNPERVRNASDSRLYSHGGPKREVR